MLDIFPATQWRVEQWKTMPEVLGVVLVGSRSRGHADALSDDDLEVLLTDEAHAALSPAECIEVKFDDMEPLKLVYDAQITTLSDLERKAGSAIDLDHWPYERARVLLDRDGRTTEAVRAAARMDPDFRLKRLRHATVDAWVASRRATKTMQRGFEGSGRLLIARSAKAMARLVFALEWRWVPLDHWLEADMRTLEDPAQAGPALIEAVVNGSARPIDDALARLEDRLAGEGVPRQEGRRELFLQLVHPSNTEERAIHGLP